MAAVALLSLAGAAHGEALERGLAIDNAAALRELDLRETAPGERSLSLAALLGASPTASSAEIFSLPAMKPLRAALGREFDDYAKRGDTLEMFDRAALDATDTRFILAGIVNRMDRAYKAPASCGEIRLIYRPIAHYGQRTSKGVATSMRLPMTMNVVLNVRNPDDASSCADIARRWLAFGDAPQPATATLTAKGGALEFVTPPHIARIETNIQIAHASANPNDFAARADYLMKVFDYDPASKAFTESAMENQIDRDRILADTSLANDFRQWLLAPGNFTALDRGVILVPDKYLAKRAIVTTPASASNTQELFDNIEIVETLAKFAAKNAVLQNINSPAGFERRLNDSACAGCHQTRAIGGFHFPGIDWSGDAPGFVVTPASPHFFGDQPRRRDILSAFRDGKPPDFSRGFSARPQDNRSAELGGTTYLNGWGAQCYAQPADKSFASWRCEDSLTCQPPSGGFSAIRAGLCFPKAD
ncbi:MAG: hypothetical protein HY242_01265 [Afipia sp.]|nr:hypothetical protein [Afipia sp.]